MNSKVSSTSTVVNLAKAFAETVTSDEMNKRYEASAMIAVQMSALDAGMQTLANLTNKIEPGSFTAVTAKTQEQALEKVAQNVKGSAAFHLFKSARVKAGLADGDYNPLVTWKALNEMVEGASSGWQKEGNKIVKEVSSEEEAKQLASVYYYALVRAHAKELTRPQTNPMIKKGVELAELLGEAFPSVKNDLNYQEVVKHRRELAISYNPEKHTFTVDLKFHPDVEKILQEELGINFPGQQAAPSRLRRWFGGGAAR